MRISPQSWEAGFTVPILEVERQRLTEVMLSVHRASKWRSHGLSAGLLVPEPFSTSHMKRGPGGKRVTDICQTKNPSTSNDRCQGEDEGNRAERLNVR